MLRQNVTFTGKVILVTGAAGFIGSNLVKRLLSEEVSIQVVGIDNMNDYYDVHIKEERLKTLSSNKQFVFVKGSIADKELIEKVFCEYQPQVVVNLAAQAGVRYSITNPDAYIESNLIEFYNILEACAALQNKHKIGMTVNKILVPNLKMSYGKSLLIKYT